MGTFAFDTFKVVKRLREVGFTEAQAEAVTSVVQETSHLDLSHLATKEDLAPLATKAELANLATKDELAKLAAAMATKDELAATRLELRSELRETELRLEAKIEAVKADLLKWLIGMIAGAVMINVLAVVGSMFGVVKLLASH